MEKRVTDTLSAGDLVRHKTNSKQEMVIIKIFENRIRCRWISSDGHFNEADFSPEELITDKTPRVKNDGML